MNSHFIYHKNNRINEALIEGPRHVVVLCEFIQTWGKPMGPKGFTSHRIGTVDLNSMHIKNKQFTL